MNSGGQLSIFVLREAFGEDVCDVVNHQKIVKKNAGNGRSACERLRKDENIL